MKLYDELKWRGLIKDVSSPDLENKLNNESITFYWGTDPTADSLHIGHYSSLITAKRLMRAGHHPILLVGGATGLIGDPRPTAEREIISKETVNKNNADSNNKTIKANSKKQKTPVAKFKTKKSKTYCKISGKKIKNQLVTVKN